MGASDSKLVFKKGIFRLSEERHIPADDAYWTSFWELPESTEDVFSLFAPADIRRTRDNALENLETLILAVTSRLFILRHHPSFPDAEFAPERDALNCVRVLTRVLPFVYEADGLQRWEERFFWGARRKRTRKSSLAAEVLFDESADDVAPRPRDTEEDFEDAKPLAEELIDTLVDLLFFSELTVPKQPNGKPKVSYAIWQSGVGCNTAVPTTKEHESNRAEILRLILTLAGQSLYVTPAALPQRGVRALTHLCSCPDKQVVLSVLCSLLNTTLKYNPASWRVPYNTLVFRDERQILVTYTLQLMLVLVLYPIPEAGPQHAAAAAAGAQKNYFRHFLGRLHRPQDFQFIVDGMTRILSQPLQEKSSYLPTSQPQTRFAPEMIMLFWEMTQCNKRFRAFIVDTERAHDFVVLTLFYALDLKTDASRQGVVRMCAFLLQTLSVEKSFGVNLNKTFTGHDSLPAAIRLPGFRGTYADFLIQSIYNLITTSQGKLTAIYPALLAVINNISPYLEGLSQATASRLMQLFSSMSAPSFLLANETNHGLLSALLESINSIVEHKHQKNPELVYAIVRNKKRIEALRSFTLESGQEEIERRNRRRKESAAGVHGDVEPLSVRSSAESIRSPTTTTTSHAHHPGLQNVAEEDDTFAIGDDDDDDDDDSDDEAGAQPTPARSTTSDSVSMASSQASNNVDVEDAVPTQVRGMSEKARGKMPAGMGAFSRQNSTTSLGGFPGGGGGGGHGAAGVGVGAGAGGAGGIGGLGGGDSFEPTAGWIESWLPELPLHTTLTVIQQVSALLPRQAGNGTGEAASAETLARIEQIQLVGVEAGPARVHSFEWSPLALGWYESLVWSFVFTSEMQVSRGTAGVWNGTAIRLFRVQETAAAGPTLTSPRGAVDAVGSNIVSRIGAMNIRGTPAGPSLGDPASPPPRGL